MGDAKPENNKYLPKYEMIKSQWIGKMGSTSKGGKGANRPRSELKGKSNNDPDNFPEELDVA